jgi:hypothetical protein
LENDVRHTARPVSTGSASQPAIGTVSLVKAIVPSMTVGGYNAATRSTGCPTCVRGTPTANWVG